MNQPPTIDDLQPDQLPTVSGTSGFVISSNRLIIDKPRLRSTVRPLDPSLPLDHPNQIILDCRTIEGWMRVMDTLLHQAWDPDGIDFTFTHDYALLSRNPKDLGAVVVVWEIVAEAPAQMTKSGIRNIKPQIREVIGKEVAVVSKPGDSVKDFIKPVSSGCTVIWGQTIDTTMMFSIYADTWGRMYEYRRKFKEFMTAYTGIFLETGLQQLIWQESTRDALYDPPHNEAYPNKSIFYRARVEEQTKARVSQIENVLIAAGMISPITGERGDTEIVSTISGIPDSPTLPTS